DEARQGIFRAVGSGGAWRHAFTAIRKPKRLHTLAAIAGGRIADAARRFGETVEKIRIARDERDAARKGRAAQHLPGEEIAFALLRLSGKRRNGSGGAPRHVP